MPSLQPSSTTPGKKNDQIISYFTLRVLIGAAGILLPVLLVLAKLLGEGTLQPEFSISDYYNNGSARDILVGILFALSFFLFSYKGYNRTDQLTATVGSVAALGVALFPTTSSDKLIHILHFVFAILLFGVFIFFSIYLFRKKAPDGIVTIQKEKRNRIYLICGLIMITCITGVVLSCFVFMPLAKKYCLVFWLEAIALVSFGVSWITKAEFLYLKDNDNAEQKNTF